MTNLDLYAKAEHLLGIEEATEALYDLYRSELDGKDVKSLLDIGCGRGGFMRRMMSDGIVCKGIDLSAVMVEESLAQGLDAECIDVAKVAGTYDAVVAIFDVLNFLNQEELLSFLDAVSEKLSEDGIFIADINTRYGFSDVAEGTMSSENEKEFLSVDATFLNDELATKFTLFEKNEDGTYTKYQDTIVQYFHKLQLFQKLGSLKLVDKQTFSLYDTKDKTLLIFKKR
ncbi:MAG: class I SAM-dependent methyltransferase [Epsilonproteobacteria bacterium]|nr:class I SAM-dependent methyltransferase [Campylobacterota bacterium]OIO15530.1 MAG: methyltransferase type 12 [Helicobacteraceae bacterium CG1_02_36_14]PIP10627.1 MAG: methyltransferase type 12 [Sulfurimonas sp. CG23_combo_of_CG06-09_8_20_14_all_36_33]PIS25600.1 MAG: methyltransferase type 12 [Sulfurimonas sp. CG08_land_8_20_14_0_20_36_33]PIU34907.1 MAG: methyltransferase type 12 [Sulfurimonas sp. CG07_land_8_20_14_0_80_36_56]PIV04620.1 MAG: methyltransferase type 12 [Sulfurimonas sp. CG03_